MRPWSGGGAVRSDLDCRRPCARSRGGSAGPARRRRGARRRPARRARRRRRSGDGSSSVGLDPVPDQRRDVEHFAARRREPVRPREHGVAGRGRQLPGRRLQDLGDEERVAAGESVQLVRPGGRCPRPELADGRRESGGSAIRPGRRWVAASRRRLAQGAVLGAGRRRGTSPRPGPGRRAAGGRGGGPGRASPRRRSAGPRSRAPRGRPCSRSIVTRAEKRASRGTPSTQASRTAPPHWSATSRSGPRADGVNMPSLALHATRASVSPIHERVEQARLPDARLAGDQHQPPVTPAGVRGVVEESSELQLPLEQAHVHQCRRGRPRTARPCARCGRCRRRTGSRRRAPTRGSGGGCGPRRRPPRELPSGPRRR